MRHTESCGWVILSHVGGSDSCTLPFPVAVPTEPMFIILDVMTSVQSALPRDPALALPVQMEVDYVRLYQSPQRHSLGCDPAGHPTKTYIDSNPDLFSVSRCGNLKCESGECSTCPTDCQYAAACRQDCRVPRCQVRRGCIRVDGRGEH